MSAKVNDFKIGLFVIVAVLLLIVGVLGFGARSYFEPKVLYETAVPGEVRGLSVGSTVELRGVPIGKVKQINFAWNVYPGTRSRMIVVLFEVHPGILPAGAEEDPGALITHATQEGMRAVIRSQGVTGIGLLSLERLDPRENPPQALDYRPRHFYVPSAPGQFTRMLDSIERSLRKVDDFNITSLTTGISNVLATVGQLGEKLDHLDVKLINDNLNALLTDLRATTAQVQATLREVKLETVSTNANAFLTGLHETNTKLQALIENLDTLPVRAAVTDIRETVQSLNAALVELKEYPAGFIFGEPPAPARSVMPPKP